VLPQQAPQICGELLDGRTVRLWTNVVVTIDEATPERSDDARRG
jgi:hypothetical protein